MRDSDDDARDDGQHTPEAATAESPARTAGGARMLANPRRVRRA
jgi:hypothetical protein